MNKTKKSHKPSQRTANRRLAKVRNTKKPTVATPRAKSARRTGDIPPRPAIKITGLNEETIDINTIDPNEPFLITVVDYDKYMPRKEARR